jgi:hypothetical protein
MLQLLSLLLGSYELKSVEILIYPIKMSEKIKMNKLTKRAVNFFPQHSLKSMIFCILLQNVDLGANSTLKLSFFSFSILIFFSNRKNSGRTVHKFFLFSILIFFQTGRIQENGTQHTLQAALRIEKVPRISTTL